MSPFLLRRASDEHLGGRLAAGEAAAFDELYRRYARRLAAYGANLTGDRSAGDDVAQTALMKAYGAIVDGRAPAHVRPWLFRIAHNAALDLVARRREVPTPSVGDRAAAPQHDPLAGVLVTAVAALPERQRHVFVLRELHGLRIDETAAELGLSAPQVEQALFAARNRLSEQLTFGGRLDCVSVRRLGRESLDVRERRALKAHLRSCSACRAEAGLHERASAVGLLAPLFWLRGLVAGLAGSSAAALKLGAVVATVGVAAGVPALRMETREARVAPAEAAVIPHDQGFQDVAQVEQRRARQPRVVTASLASVAVHHVRLRQRTSSQHSRHGPAQTVTNSGSARGPGSSGEHQAEAAVTGDHRGRGSGGDDPARAPAPPATAATQPVAPTPAVQEPADGGHEPDSSGPGSGALAVDSSHDGGSGHDGSGSGGSAGSDGSGGSGGSGGGDHSVDDLTDSH